MNVLFLCKDNEIKSQIAEALFNSISLKHKSQSAGIETNYKGTIGKKNKVFVEAMKKFGLDISNQKIKKITKKIVKGKDIIVLMDGKGNIPEYIYDCNRIIAWSIKDVNGRDIQTYIENIESIEKKIEELILDLNREN